MKNSKLNYHEDEEQGELKKLTETNDIKNIKRGEVQSYWRLKKILKLNERIMVVVISAERNCNTSKND